MNYISIQNLNINYDELKVFENFNKEFKSGIHWIQGFNGCGKSTLLKSISGILKVPDGVVEIMGFDINSQAIKAKSELCYVADKPEVFPFMTGIQFLEMVAKIKGTKLTQDLYDWLDNINLTQFNNTEFSQMSFGTRRKFTLSACLIAQPQVILLDEPFNGLDTHTTMCLKEWLIQSKDTKCILIASHDTHILKEEYDSILNV